VGEGGLPSPDEIARQVGPLLLGVQSGQDYSGLELQGEGGPRILSVAHSLIWSRVPPYSSAVQPPAGVHRARMVVISLGPPEMWKYCQMRNQVTFREVENSDFILHQQSQMSSHSKCWTPNNKFTRFLKGSAGHQVARNMLVVNR
jgi:hypothetical protein